MLERYTRLQVFGVHLGISLVVFLVLAGIMYWHWFPGPFFVGDGGWQGVRIVAAVDLVLGPSLTLMLFNPKKKKHRTLLLDLSAVALVQILALAWGVWTTYNSRTIAVVWGSSSFYSVSAGAIDRANKVRGLTESIDIAGMDQNHPSQIYARPYTGEEYGEFLASVMNGEPDIYLRAERYEPLASNWDAVKPAAADVDALIENFPVLEQKLAELGDDRSQLILFRLKLRFADALIAFERESPRLRDILIYRTID